MQEKKLFAKQQLSEKKKFADCKNVIKVGKKFVLSGHRYGEIKALSLENKKIASFIKPIFRFLKAVIFKKGIWVCACGDDQIVFWNLRKNKSDFRMMRAQGAVSIDHVQEKLLVAGCEKLVYIFKMKKLLA